MIWFGMWADVTSILLYLNIISLRDILIIQFTGGQLAQRFVHVMRTDFGSLALIRHLVSHALISVRFDCSCYDAKYESLSKVKAEVSSVTFAVIALLNEDRSAVYRKCSEGPTILPLKTLNCIYQIIYSVVCSL